MGGHTVDRASRRGGRWRGGGPRPLSTSSVLSPDTPPKAQSPRDGKGDAHRSPLGSKGLTWEGRSPLFLQ